MCSIFVAKSYKFTGHRLYQPYLHLSQSDGPARFRILVSYRWFWPSRFWSVLGTILGPVWDPVTGQPRLRINRDIRNLTGQPLIINVLQWAGNMARAPGKRGIYKTLYGRAMGRRPQGRPRIQWVDNVRQDATSLEVRDWQGSTWDRGQR